MRTMFLHWLLDIVIGAVIDDVIVDIIGEFAVTGVFGIEGFVDVHCVVGVS